MCQCNKLRKTEFWFNITKRQKSIYFYEHPKDINLMIGYTQ